MRRKYYIFNTFCVILKTLGGAMLRHKVTKIQIQENYLLKLEFDNGETGIFDVKPYISGEWFSKLSDKHYFQTVKPNGFNIEWADGQDICPDDLYYNSKKFS